MQCVKSINRSRHELSESLSAEGGGAGWGGRARRNCGSVGGGNHKNGQLDQEIALPQLPVARPERQRSVPLLGSRRRPWAGRRTILYRGARRPSPPGKGTAGSASHRPPHVFGGVAFCKPLFLDLGAFFGVKLESPASAC